MRQHQSRLPAIRPLGFTLIELLVTITLIAVLSAISIANFSQVRKTAYNTMALTDYTNLKRAVLDQAFQDPTGSASYRIRPMVGPAALPHPLTTARLSEGVRLVTARRTRSGARETIRFELTHLQGSISYRYVSNNGRVVEQQIKVNR